MPAKPEKPCQLEQAQQIHNINAVFAVRGVVPTGAPIKKISPKSYELNMAFFSELGKILSKVLSRNLFGWNMFARRF